MKTIDINNGQTGNEEVGELAKSDLGLILGATCVGKTAVLLNQVNEAMNKKESVVVVLHDITQKDFVSRLVSTISGVSEIIDEATKVEQGKLTHALTKIKFAKLDLITDKDVSFKDIKTFVENKVSNGFPVDNLFIDELHTLKGQEGLDPLDIAEQTYLLKEIAVGSNVRVVAGVQKNVLGTEIPKYRRVERVYNVVN